LTASVLFPDISSAQIIEVLAGGDVLGAVVGLVALVRDRRIRAAELTVPVEWRRNSSRLAALAFEDGEVPSRTRVNTCPRWASLRAHTQSTPRGPPARRVFSPWTGLAHVDELASEVGGSLLDANVR
jgi:hypothetical protein